MISPQRITNANIPPTLNQLCADSNNGSVTSAQCELVLVFVLGLGLWVWELTSTRPCDRKTDSFTSENDM